MIQLNLKPDKLLPSVFTLRPVVAHDTLKADRAAQTLPLVFIVLILVRIISWAHCTSVFHLGVRARGCEMMHTKTLGPGRLDCHRPQGSFCVRYFIHQILPSSLA